MNTESRDYEREKVVIVRQRALLILSVLAASQALSCEREERRFSEVPPLLQRSGGISLSDLHPGEAPPPSPPQNPYQDMAYAMSEGQRLYEWFNCVGCHAHGGGGMGPPLMDAKWIYGSEPANIFATIVEGRPNGMPSFRGKIPDYQVWQLVAYVRSLSGLAPMDAAPGRSDSLSVSPTPAMTPEQKPRPDSERPRP